jgi:hypothetical protein
MHNRAKTFNTIRRHQDVINNQFEQIAVVQLKSALMKRSATKSSRGAPAKVARTEEPSGLVAIGQGRSDASSLLSRLSDPLKYKELFPLLLSVPVDEFFATYWERHPLLNKREGSGKSLESLFSDEYLKQLVTREKLSYGTNMTFAKYEAGARKSKPHEPGSVATAAEVSRSFKQGFTIQFYQPQRFSDPLYLINASFESLFGSLAGASAYLTPANSQGLAPHYDDVEVFILQTQGRKKWRLWRGDLELPETCSNDIDRANLPTEYSEFILEAGDLLYFPRGTIHEAISLDEFSTHVTISVYQKTNYRSIVERALPSLLEAAVSTNVEWRRGLPIRLQDDVGTYAGSLLAGGGLSVGIYSSRREQLRSKLRQLIHSLGDALTDRIMDAAADELTFDFVRDRLPPPDSQSFSAGQAPGQKTPKSRRAKVTGATEVGAIPRSDYFAFVQRSPEGAEMLALCNSRNNDRLRHMNHPPADNGEPSESDEEPGSDSEEGALLG